MLANTRKTPDWTLSQLEEILKSCKNKKPRESNGHKYEFFKFGGQDLKRSLFDLCNRVKMIGISYDLQTSHYTSLYIGGRKNKNVRDDIYVINAIMHEAKKDKREVIYI